MDSLPRNTQRHTYRRLSGMVVAAALLTLVSGCGSSSSGDSAASGPAAGVARDSAGSGPGTTDAVSLGKARSDIPLQTRSVIMTGQVSLQSKSLTTLRADIDRLVARYGGYVDQENTVDDSHGRVSHSTLQLRIPSDGFDPVMAAFPGIATVTYTSRKAEDVTTEVIDVDARVRTAEVSLRRLRSFLGQATNVDSVIRLESEISQREADLGSLLAQQRYLRNQTSLATITVSMTRAGTTTADQPLGHAGFFTGLRNGWNALLDLALVAATVAGALLPFALVLAMVLVPLVLLLRARRRRGPAAVAAPATTPPAGQG